MYNIYPLQDVAFVVGGEKRERLLVPRARSYMTGHLRYPEYNIFEEVPSLWGRPDLVAIRSETPISSPSRPIGRKGLLLISLLRREGPIESDDLAHRLGLTKRALHRSISEPLSRGLVELQGETISLGPHPIKSLDEISAVEIKVRDWISGLRQATRYKTFADQVFLFVGRRVSGIDTKAFRKAKVGLVEIQPEPHLLVRALPTRGENVELSRMLIEENIRHLTRKPRQMPSSDTRCSC